MLCAHVIVRVYSKVILIYVVVVEVIDGQIGR